MPVTYRIVADKPEELSEDLRALAKPTQDGKVTVDALPEGYAVENVAGLRSTLVKLREQTKQFEQSVRAFEAAGLTAEQARDAAEALSQKKAGTLKSSADLDAWKAEAEKKFQGEAKSIADKLTKRTERLRNELVRGKLAPIVAAKGGSAAMDAILVLAERNIRVEEDANGDLIPVVVGSDGKTAALTKKSGSMDPMGFDELIEQMRESPATRGLFEAKAAGGSGSASQAAGSGRAGNRDSAQPLSARSLIRAGNDAAAAGKRPG